MRPPEYFDTVQREASDTWRQLTENKQIAGPWHQLFKQVQSPRHVLSELLQNADDAGATEATAEIDGDDFIFSHNGEDFNSEQFQSLCRFGFSNKRVLHTIGFRGVGFKSTFSIGNEVRLYTPTLAVAYQRERFTEPVWIDDSSYESDRTEIRVTIKNEKLKTFLEQNFDEWLGSPASLLFFKHIKKFTISGQELQWKPIGDGSIERSQWFSLSNEMGKKYLLIQSEDEPFPEDALDEIKQERMALDGEMEMPPCRVEILLGVEGRLFVVLPTGVCTSLPFACNAPFMQDTARLKIKDPETSPTNSWLLNRIGKLTAEAILTWIRKRDLSIEIRSEAYDLWPNVDREDLSLEGVCATVVEESFQEALLGHKCVLADNGQVVAARECIAVHPDLLRVWSSEMIASSFDDRGFPIVCRHISQTNMQKLFNWDCVRNIDIVSIIGTLQSKHLPKPKSWHQLLMLWGYVSSAIKPSYYDSESNRLVRIVPVRGKEVLYSADEVVRLGEKQILNDSDSEFLSPYLLAQDQNWTRYLAEQRRNSQNEGSENLQDLVESAYSVLHTLKLDQASDVNLVIEKISVRFFALKVALTECIRMAHISAALGAEVPDSFCFITCNGDMHRPDESIVVDFNADLDMFVENDWYQKHVLHPGYSVASASCSAEDWEQWLTSDRSRISTFVPIVQKNEELWRKANLISSLRDRGYLADPAYRFVTEHFIMEDWNFDQTIWKFWLTHFSGDGKEWAHILSRIIRQPSSRWHKTLSAKVVQIAKNGNSSTITSEPLTPAWITMFRGMPCLEDTWGNPHQPAELLRRTPETEPLLDLEPFVKADLDNEASRPLLIALGVRDTPTNTDGLMDRIRGWARMESPSLAEVIKWYQRLDQIAQRCNSSELAAITKVFENEKVILTTTGWAQLSEVFLTSDEDDAPGAATIHPALHHLSLWQRIGVAPKPNAELALKWLKSLPSSYAPSSDESKRIVTLLSRYPERIWSECLHWLDLEGKWTPVADLKYTRTMKSLVSYSHLFSPIRRQTANLQMLSEEQCLSASFSNLIRLTDVIEERLQENKSNLSKPLQKQWLTALGKGLERLVLSNKDTEKRTRQLGTRLAATVLQFTPALETIPYIAGVPAGTPRKIDATWKDRTLFVAQQSSAKLARVIPKELGRFFEDTEIDNAIMLCYERPLDFVNEYLEENFTLADFDAAAIINTTPESSASESVKPETQAESPSATEPVLETTENTIAQIDETVIGDSVDSDTPVGETPADEAGQDENEPAGDEDVEKSPKKPPKPAQPKLIERFALARGFSKDGENRYYHPDGNWLEHGKDGSSYWELYSKDGEIQQYYWLKDHCLEKDPLQIGADIWALCQQFPDLYSLVLVDSGDAPVITSGSGLQNMCEKGELELCPATYRLVYKND